MSVSLSVGQREQTICNLERGTIVTKFYARKKPEKRKLLLRRETSQLIWLQIQASDDGRINNNYEGALEIREIHEVRPGRSSKDFEKWPDLDPKSCLVIFYGAEFKLRALSFVALSPQECNMWIGGLRDMVADSETDSVERWLRKEFYAMDTNGRDAVTQKDLKTFLGKLNCKISTAKLMEVFAEVDVKKRNEIGFDSFTKLYQKLTITPNALQDLFGSGRRFPYSRDGAVITLHDFQQFLKVEQREPDVMCEAGRVANVIKDFLQDVQRDVHEPYFTVSEVILCDEEGVSE